MVKTKEEMVAEVMKAWEAAWQVAKEAARREEKEEKAAREAAWRAVKEAKATVVAVTKAERGEKAAEAVWREVTKALEEKAAKADKLIEELDEHAEASKAARQKNVTTNKRIWRQYLNTTNER